MMQKKEKFLENGNTWVMLILVFMASTIIRGIIATIYGEYTILADEFLHARLAQNIAAGNGLVIRGALLDYTECLYSIVISPAFLLTHNTRAAHILILWINASLMSSAVFPIFLIAKKFLKNSRHIWLATAYGLLIGEMCYTLQAIQENLNYPLMMWFFLAFTHVILERRNHMLCVSGLGVFAFLLSRCKKMNLAIIFAVLLYFAVQFWVDKKVRWQTVRDALVYIGTYATIKLIFDFITRLLLSDAVSSGGIANSVLRVLNFDTMPKLIYPAIEYVIFTVLATGIFPLPMLIGNWKTIPEKSRKMLTFVLSFLVMSVGAICVLIVPSENLGDTVIRFHSRYFFYAFIVIMILFLQVYEEYQKGSEGRSEPVFILGCGAGLMAFLPVTIAAGSHADGVSTLYLQLLTGNELLKNTMRCALILTIVLGMYFEYKKHVKKVYGLTAIILILVTPVNCRLYISYQGKNIGASMQQNDALLLNDYASYLKNEQSAQENFLLISDGTTATPFEIYLDLPYKLTNTGNLEVGKEIEFKELPLRGYNTIVWYDSDAVAPEYILSERSLDLKGYDEVDIGMKTFHLLKGNGDVAMLRSRKSNIYGDHWLGETAATLELSGSVGCTYAVLSLTVDNGLLGIDTSANYTDGSGYSGSLTIPYTHERTTIEIPVYKSADAVSYSVTITPTQATQPSNGDTRNLSFRLWDYQIIE